MAAIEALADRCQQHLVVGRRDPGVEPPCVTSDAAGLSGSGLDSARVDMEAIERELDRFCPDAIHLHGLVHPEILARAASWPALLTAQDHRLFCPGRGKWTAAGAVCKRPMDEVTCAGCFEDAGYFLRIFDLTRRRLEAAAELRLCVLSAYMQAELVAVGIGAERIQIVPPAVRGLLPGGPRQGPGCGLFVGRLVEAKGVFDAVLAWRISGLQLPLVVAGTGPLRSSLQDAGVSVTGWLAREELAQLYRRAEIVLMPSRWQEPFGIVGLEALAMGVPVAAWSSGGVAEWHPGQGLVPWGHVEALAGAAQELVGTRTDAPLGFGAVRFAERLEDLFAQIAGR